MVLLKLFLITTGDIIQNELKMPIWILIAYLQLENMRGKFEVVVMIGNCVRRRISEKSDR